MKAARSLPLNSPQRGLSLIEILVGLAIGVIGMIAMFQTVGVWNRHTQTTSAGGDAQVAGTLGLFSIERDFKQSGHGFGEATVPVMGCMVQAFALPPIPLRPVDILPGALGAPDQINVLSGESSFFTEGQDFLSSTPTSKTLRRRGGFKPGDLVVVADAGAGLPGTANCSLAEITSDANPDLLTVDHLQAAYVPFGLPARPAAPSQFNPPGGLAFPYVSGTVYNLGPRPQWVNWQIANNRTLQRTEQLFRPLLPDDVADGVINLKAEYGVDLNGNTVIEPGEWLAAIPPGNNWNQVLAIRVAILVRSRQFERGGDTGRGPPVPVTLAAPTYFGGLPFAMTNVDGNPDTFLGAARASHDPNNWHYYRYRVYERVIPLKNMLWALP
ncbi:MAG: PilW family protein [Pseudomonadota bacterium]|nr:PilW family protein [Pseudomonadota bacterium]